MNEYRQAKDLIDLGRISQGNRRLDVAIALRSRLIISYAKTDTEAATLEDSGPVYRRSVAGKTMQKVGMG